VEKGIIRQFVAMPLGDGYTAEEQLTGKADHGGLQVIVYPMQGEEFEKRFPKREREARFLRECKMQADLCAAAPLAGGMGLAPGGRMKQKIYDDPFPFSVWDQEHSSRCFVHIANSRVWHALTGTAPPTEPPTARQYSQAGLPWFDYYREDGKALPGAGLLNKLKSVATLGKEKREHPLPENKSAEPELIVQYRVGLKPDQVREGRF
jgi:hypothetical protein